MNHQDTTDLTRAQFLAAWSTLALGAPPVELELRAEGRTLADRERILATAMAQLRNRGLADAHGPTAELAAALRLLALAPLTVDLRLSSGLVAVGALDGGDGVVVLGDPSGPRLRTMSGREVVGTLIGLVGPLRTGRARPVNIPAEVLDTARREVTDGSLWTLAERLTRHGVDAVDAHSLARMCTDITVAGQLGATERSGVAERRGPWVIGFHRGAAGDFLQLRRDGCVTIAPITADTLHSQVRELVTELAA